MKKSIITIVVLCMVLTSLFGCTGSGYTKSTKEDQSVFNGKITLNKLGDDLTGKSVSAVDFKKSMEKDFGESVSIYRVKNRTYKEKDIDVIAKELHTSIIGKTNSDEIPIQYSLKNGGYIEYYKTSGGLVYVSDKESNDGIEGGNIDEGKCKKAVEDFIKNSKILDFDELEFAYANTGESVETADGTEPLSYSLCYKKKTPGNMEYAGIGPGIKIEIDASYSVCGFASVDRTVGEETGKFTTLNKEKVADKICNGDGVAVTGAADDEKLGVTVNKVELRLYSDPIDMDQEYMAPYYFLECLDANKKNVTIVLPAVEDDRVEYK